MNEIEPIQQSSFSILDALFQLFSIGVVILIIFLIVSIFRSNSERKKQLDRIEMKLDKLNEKKR